MKSTTILFFGSCLFLGIGYFLGKHSQKAMQTQNLPSSENQQTAKQPSPSLKLDDVIDYQIPLGWKKIVDPITPDVIELKSPGMTRGATILLFEKGAPPEKFLAQNAVADTVVEGGVRVILGPAKVGNMESVNAFVCFEGCTDTYYFKKKNYVWSISFECAQGCESKEHTDKSKYAKDRDLFLKSIIFKDQ